MMNVSPQKLGRSELLTVHGLTIRSTCQHCGCKIVEVDGDAYLSVRGWMCEACFYGDQKVHCKSRPYQRPLARPRA